MQKITNHIKWSLGFIIPSKFKVSQEQNKSTKDSIEETDNQTDVVHLFI